MKGEVNAMRRLVPSLAVLVLMFSGGGTTVRAEVLAQAINVGEQVTGTLFGPTTCGSATARDGRFQVTRSPKALAGVLHRRRPHPHRQAARRRIHSRVSPG